ncbi:hypothetical protein COW46_04335 [Candidatus Gracilibacteria bacterium CG17_big_fil_post_rev_8_21_14_2_50_48_13]|nr:MAG: hypothetical protein COW46_04335 [Candidatus Gracilibacteria bacterium CG17_big_fil_post_rev_8_21_14_2_50_48_13]
MTTGTAQKTDVATDMTPAQVAELRSMLDREMVEKYPDIIQMLFQTPSLIFDEKKYWIQLMPLMAPDHIERLRGILLAERQKLAEINARYTEGVQSLEALNRPSQEEIARKRQAIAAEEAAAAHRENEEEASLMSSLKDV